MPLGLRPPAITRLISTSPTPSITGIFLVSMDCGPWLQEQSYYITPDSKPDTELMVALENYWLTVMLEFRFSF